MKSLTTSQLSIFSIAGFAAAIALTTAFQQTAISDPLIPVVTITAQRMTEQQKIAFDLAQSTSTVHTVEITGKRLTAEEKLTFDRQDQSIQQARTKLHKKPALLV
ncbi:hypothetical protein Undi14_16005 [Undibacterium sp. 14-3-2]|uniref:hypothetical protein n=1 Tax=Undibacterium sp. 14-3-2 TaxID=2800129 RepID=UPI0019055A39|nr:hypothetical protein [Undibacterium sp. 14-3-2]MBK1891535.1 hypothetical protein [Undibacterium sp. 14-3-2]